MVTLLLAWPSSGPEWSAGWLRHSINLFRIARPRAYIDLEQCVVSNHLGLLKQQKPFKMPSY